MNCRMEATLYAARLCICRYVALPAIIDGSITRHFLCTV